MPSHILNMPRSFGSVRISIGPDHYVPSELDPDGWEHREYRVTISYRDQSMWVTYRQGMAHDAGAVDPREVLNCIASDITGADQSFTDWCAEYGYEPDSISARDTYRAIERQRKSVARVFKGIRTAIFLDWAARLGE